MLPIALDLTRIPVLLAGSGDLLLKRLSYLDEDKAGNVTVWCENPSHALRQAAGERLIQRLPKQRDLENYSVIMMVGLERDVAERIVGWARAVGKLVNVEDINDLCDFYFTANVRRGDLVIAVSTSGASPTLARKVRDYLAERFGPEWEGYTQEMAEFRRSLKQQKKSISEVLSASEAFLSVKGWLEDDEDTAEVPQVENKEPV